MELLIQLGAIFLTLVVILNMRARYEPNSLSDAELLRRVEANDPAAMFEQQRRELMSALVGFRAVRVAIFLASLVTLLVATHEWWVGLLLVCGYYLIAELIMAKGWFDNLAARVQHQFELRGLPIVAALAPVFRVFAPRYLQTEVMPELASRDDLSDLIERDTRVLTPGEKSGLLASMHFGQLRVADIMVPRGEVVVVGVGETVGPVLLDRLHKAGHKIYPVVKKDLDHIQGFLYVGDIAHADPEIDTVKDALRPTVHYISANAPLAGLLSASLQSGRQLFIVVDDNGNTQGLATLQDAIVRLLGAAPPDHFYTSTDPKKVKLS